MKHNKKYTKEILEKTVKNNISVSGVLRDLNIRPSGGIHSHITKMIKKYEIDTSHMLGKSSNRGKHSGNVELTPREVLVRMEQKSPRQKTNLLFRALIKIGRKYKCTECGMSGMWNNKPITLHIDHIDGDHTNNRPSNLKFLCPNCHSQTQTYCRSKTATTEKKNVLETIRTVRNKNRHIRKPAKKKNCTRENCIVCSEKLTNKQNKYCSRDCMGDIFVRSKTCLVCDKNLNKMQHKYCSGTCRRTIDNKKENCVVCDKKLTYKQSEHCSQKCYKMKIRKVTNRPDAIQLKTDIDSMPMVHVGSKYGVSDNAIRKWARQYKIL